MKKYIHYMAITAALWTVASTASADSISPEEFSADLAVGESVTLRKTVTTGTGAPTDALIDAFFLIDTSGSMGAEIDAARTAAADIVAGLSAFGNAAAGVGVFSEAAIPGTGDGTAINTTLNLDITTDGSAVIDAINDVTLGVPDFGGSFPESSNTAIDFVANNASFRPGSTRFIFVLGDASSNEFVSDADVISSLAGANANLIGLNFGGAAFANDITDLGGTVIPGTASPAAIVSDITEGIISGFETFSTVSVDDLGAGLPSIDVSSVCVSADIGTCSGADAIGDFDRSVERTFEFDVTFTRVAGGDAIFDTAALVDGGAIAFERDTFLDGGTPPPTAVPEPSTALLLLGGLCLLSARRRAIKPT